MSGIFAPLPLGYPTRASDLASGVRPQGGDSAHHTAMVRLAANLSFLFKERPFLDRFQAAAAAGFRAVPHTSSCCRNAAAH